MLIRPFQDADAETCARLMSISEPWLTLGRDFHGALAFLLDGTKETHVATEDGAIAGFIVLNMRGAFVGYIQTICVDAATRGKGVGSRLIRFAEERIFREAPNVFLCVTDFNVDAQRLYERLGYERIGVLRDYIKRGYDEILMRKALMPVSEFVRG